MFWERLTCEQAATSISPMKLVFFFFLNFHWHPLWNIPILNLWILQHFSKVLWQLISPSQSLYLRQITRKHPHTRLERESNPISHCSTGQRPRGHCDRQRFVLYGGPLVLFSITNSEHCVVHIFTQHHVERCDVTVVIPPYSRILYSWSIFQYYIFTDFLWKSSRGATFVKLLSIQRMRLTSRLASLHASLVFW